MYIYDVPNGTATVIKQNDSINNNWILANYHSSMALGAYRYYLVSTQLFATMCVLYAWVDACYNIHHYSYVHLLFSFVQIVE